MRCAYATLPAIGIGSLDTRATQLVSMAALALLLFELQIQLIKIYAAMF